MCGIAGIHIKHPGSDKGLRLNQLEVLIDNLLLGIEPRGTDATGIAAVTEGGKHVLLHKEAVPATEFIKDRPRLSNMDNIRTILLHTRFATKGHESKNENNHPVLYKTCFATHNGHINNDDALFIEHELDRRAEVDSEAIPAMFSKFGLDQAHRALQVLEGNMAVAVIDPVNAPDKLVLAKGWGSPLIFIETPEFLLWASTLDALQDAWGKCLGTPPKAKRFWQLNEGGLLFVDGDTVENLSFKVAEKKKVYFSTQSSWDSGGSMFDHWGSASYTERGKDRREVCQSCGCTGFWHSGVDYNGPCLAKPPEMNGHYCQCNEFVKAESCSTETIPASFLECGNCEDWFAPNQVEQVWNDYYMCRECLTGTFITEGDDTVEIPVESTESRELVLVSSRECPHETCGDVCENPYEISGVRVFADESEPIEAAVWTPTGDAEADTEQRHKAILAAVSGKTEYSVDFIEWLLFKCPLEAAEKDPWLVDIRDHLDETYADVEDDFNALEAEVWAARHGVVLT